MKAGGSSLNTNFPLYFVTVSNRTVLTCNESCSVFNTTPCSPIRTISVAAPQAMELQSWPSFNERRGVSLNHFPSHLPKIASLRKCQIEFGSIFCQKIVAEESCVHDTLWHEVRYAQLLGPLLANPPPMTAAVPA